ncbi:MULTISPECIES: hypothetical protein [Streptomyces]|uniref:hypothetical protein n=1 Tax=Streptomyces TaxID=1883 RepID=UPI00039B58B1|nr:MULTISPECIES: hypothetical protein [Streptomyces]MBZ6114584.1 hypothetical protein [Streptomyces olivaceus]MBZ6128427.1 hypothetical protein [Streptomyces olivaceus]MBZ6149289.1 hypothetical protein [Streptomyces olivaceus]MBZ6163191.1 hypothetical protein [Streptomyces olivaceus]MBZ6190995.1 hypothetical protein [Streptomyces olivaceus]
MSDGFFFWYTEPFARDGVERVLGALETQGVHLAHPESNAITVITNGPDSWGEQLQVSRAELVELLTLRDRAELNFQLWLNDETDMFTRFRRVSDRGLVVEFGLDGMWHAEREAAIRAVSLVVDAERARTFGVVVDRRGLTEEMDWDGLVLGRPVVVAEWPDMLEVRPEVAAEHAQLRSVHRNVERPLVTYRSGADD